MSSKASPRSARRGASGAARAAASQLRLPDIAFPADLLGDTAPDHTRIDIDIVVLNAAGELDRLRMHLTRRVTRGTGLDLWGQDEHRLLSVHVTGRGGNWVLRGRTTTEPLDGQRSERLIHFIQAVQPGNRVGLALPGGSPSVTTLLGAPATEAPSEGLAEVIGWHAQIERHIGRSVLVPEAYSPDDVQDTEATAALLRGEVVEQPWSSVEWAVSLADAHEQMSEEPDSWLRLEYESPWTWALGNTKTPIGVVTLTYLEARIADAELPPLTAENADDEVRLTLVPGNDRRSLIRLVSTATDDGLADDPQRWFWAPTWQSREHEVDEHVRAGRVTQHESTDDFLSYLDQLT